MESCSRSPETQNGRKPVGTTACPFLEPDSCVFPNNFGLLSFACLPLEPSIPKDQWQGIRRKKNQTEEGADHCGLLLCRDVLNGGPSACSPPQFSQSNPGPGA